MASLRNIRYIQVQTPVRKTSHHQRSSSAIYQAAVSAVTSSCGWSPIQTSKPKSLRASSVTVWKKQIMSAVSPQELPQHSWIPTWLLCSPPFFLTYFLIICHYLSMETMLKAYPRSAWSWGLLTMSTCVTLAVALCQYCTPIKNMATCFWK